MSDGLNNGLFKDPGDQGKAEATAWVNKEGITFSVTSNGNMINLSGDTKLEYTNTGFWEVFGYYCSGTLETGSQKIVGTTYHNGNYVNSAEFTLIAK